MATLDPYVETSWDTTSYVNPTNMNHIERGITNSRKSENISYDSNNSVKDMIDKVTDYSETEKVVGKWIDGKPLYQKTISLGALPNNTSKSVAHGITNLKRIVDFRGVANRTATGYTFSVLILPFINTANTIVQIGIDATHVRMISNENMESYNESYVTIKYQKTTD